jgi:hypothetical protein
VALFGFLFTANRTSSERSFRLLLEPDAGLAGFVALGPSMPLMFLLPVLVLRFVASFEVDGVGERWCGGECELRNGGSEGTVPF